MSSPSPLPPITRRLGITPRIRALVACVPHGTRVFADIGSNHGILPVAVLRADRAQRCIAVDCSTHSLADVERRLRRSRCEEHVELRLGDGLTPLAPGEADVICIAGLGPRSVTEILEAGLPRLTEGVRLIVSRLPDRDNAANVVVLDSVRRTPAIEQSEPLADEHIETRKSSSNNWMSAKSAPESSILAAPTSTWATSVPRSPPSERGLTGLALPRYKRSGARWKTRSLLV